MEFIVFQIMAMSVWGKSGTALWCVLIQPVATHSITEKKQLSF